MYIAIKELHSFIGFMTLTLFTFAIVFNLTSWLSKKPYTKVNKIITLVGMISVHTQVLIGLILYLLSPLGLSNSSGAAMKDAQSRLYMLEHPLIMIIAFILVTVGYSKAKKLTVDNAKYKTIITFFFISLILILSRIPWSTWI
jgi:uncharacterized membrane protein